MELQIFMIQKYLEATDFHDIEVPKVDTGYTSLVVISPDLICWVSGTNHLQVFLKECKHIEKN